jgi:hypothetical protein
MGCRGKVTMSNSTLSFGEGGKVTRSNSFGEGGRTISFGEGGDLKICLLYR